MSEAYPSVFDKSLPIDALKYDIHNARRVTVDAPDNSIRMIECSQVLQFLTGPKRIDVWNEWYRVLVPGGRARVVVPYYSHVQALAHPLVQWPPFSEYSFFFLDKAWRSASESHAVDGLECDFEVESTSIEMDSVYATRTQEWRDDAVRWFNNCAVQMTVWLVKR